MAITLPIPTASETPLGVSTYLQIDTSAIENLLGAILIELRSLNWMVQEGFQIKGIGPTQFTTGITVNTDGVFNRS